MLLAHLQHLLEGDAGGGRYFGGAAAVIGTQAGFAAQLEAAQQMTHGAWGKLQLLRELVHRRAFLPTL